jgi:hypothetical protein
VVSKAVIRESGRKDGPSETVAESSCELLVGEPDGKGQKIQITFVRLRYQAKDGGVEGPFYDTDKPAGDDRDSLQVYHKAMIGMPLVATLSASGKVGEISGVNEIVRKAVAADDSGGARTVAAICKESLIAALSPLLFQLPEKPIVTGYAWTRNVPEDLEMMGAIKMAQNYKVKSVLDTSTGKVADISCVAKNTSDKIEVTGEDSAKFAEICPIDEITRETSATARVNLGTRMLVSWRAHTKGTLKGTWLLDGANEPFNSLAEIDREVVVTPSKAPPTSSTRPR